MKNDLKPCRLKKTKTTYLHHSLWLISSSFISHRLSSCGACVCVSVCDGLHLHGEWNGGGLISPLWTGWSNMMSSLQCSVISLPSGGAVQLHGQRQRAIPQRGVPLLPTGSSGQLHSGQPPHRHWWDKMIHIWMFIWMNWPNGMAHSLSDYWKKAV